MKDKTKELSVIRAHPERYLWGDISRIIDVGRYTVIEYLTKDKTWYFALYIDSLPKSSMFRTLEEALIMGFASVCVPESIDEDGTGSFAMGRAACKLLNLQMK